MGDFLGGNPPPEGEQGEILKKIHLSSSPIPGPGPIMANF